MIATPLYVLIPTHGRAPLLKRTLASLAECALPEGYVETVVVENGSKEGAEAICQQADARLNARYLHVEKANKSHALNEALKTLPAEALVVYLDDDVRLEPGVLNAYTRAANADGEGFFFGGPLSVDYESPPPVWLIKYLPASAVGWEPEEDVQPEKFFGANWAAYVRDIRDVGGFSAFFGPGMVATGQETDAQRRMVTAGKKPVYVPDARVWHYVPQERSSARWALHRAFRDGTSLGYRLREEYPVKGSAAYARHVFKAFRYARGEWKKGGLFNGLYSLSLKMGDLYGKTRKA